jgi:putative endopeptidase
MKKNKAISRISYLLSVLMVIMCFLPTMAFAEQNALTREEAAQLICQAGVDYNSSITEKQVLKGYENGQLYKDKPVTKLEAYIMLTRAFGILEAPTGHNLRSGAFDLELNDMPNWAGSELNNLSQAGLLAEKGPGVLGKNDSISKDELQKMIDRLYTYIGSSERDNLYSAINNDWLDNSIIDAGYTGNTTLHELDKLNQVFVQNIITDAVKSASPKGTNEQKIADFYITALDIEARNKQGIEPIRKYLDGIDAAQNMNELLAVDAMLDNETGVCELIPWGVWPDAKDSTQNLLDYYGATNTLDKESYINESPEVIAALKTLITKYLIVGGETAKNAERLAKDVYDLEKDLSYYDLNVQEYYDINKTYNKYTKADFIKLFTGFDMGRVLKNLGMGQTESINVVSVEMTKRAAELMTDSNLEVWKAKLKFRLIYNFSEILSEEIERTENEFYQVYTGASGELSLEEKAINMTSEYLSTPIEQTFVKEYFSETAKEDVEAMANQFIDVYKERLDKNEWLSEETKKKAIKKLETMNVKIGYPEVWPESIENVEIKGSKDGGSFFQNVVAIKSMKNQDVKNSIGKPVDKTKWEMNVYEVNAYYNSSANEIVFPAGILQSPIYDENASKEANLGAIGVIIAHEITHAFDNNGAAYDENGNANNWWTEDDFTNFNEKCEKVVELYDGIEVAPGIENDGELTVSENVADLGGVSCALEVASKLKNPDYKALFDNFAVLFRTTRARDTLDYYTRVDVHSNGMIRINQTVKNFDKFYETYNVSENDGMYLSPEERIRIW